jgi:cysteine desulfurase
MPSPEYFDYAATTPVDRRVAELMLRYMCEDYGNAASRTHSYGTNARAAVEEARALVAELVSASEDEVIFTSGATEANNISTLGLASFGERVNRRHLVTTAIEHKAVLEPLEHLAKSGFDLTILPVDQSGSVDPDEVRLALRSDTLLVSVMHVNNETGVIQPIKEIGEALADHHSYFHVDAAQGFGKELELLRNPRVDLISISGHKIYAPQTILADPRYSHATNQSKKSPKPAQQRKHHGADIKEAKAHS